MSDTNSDFVQSKETSKKKTPNELMVAAKNEAQSYREQNETLHTALREKNIKISELNKTIARLKLKYGEK